MPTQSLLNQGASGVSNEVLVTGSGSVISNTGSVYLGYYESFGTVILENGGQPVEVRRVARGHSAPVVSPADDLI